MQKFFLTASMLSIFFLFVACGKNQYMDGSLTTGLSTDRTVYFSVVSKDTKLPYLARIPTEQHVILATMQPISESLNAIDVTEGKGMVLHIVEPLGTKTLPHEVARLDRIAILATSVDEVRNGGLLKIASSPDFMYLGLVPFSERKPYRPQAEETPELRDIINSLPTNHVGSADPVDAVFLTTKLAELSGEKTVKIDGVETRIKERGYGSGRALAQKYLVQEYAALGYKAEAKPYSRVFIDTVDSGFNIVAEKKGLDPSKYLMITAHFDNVGNAGADDNGSGTVSLLGIAKALQDITPKVNIRFVSFDQEESGLIGSESYALQLKEAGDIDQLIGVINLDMTGYDKGNEGAVSLSDCNENTSSALTKLVTDSIKRYNYPLKINNSCSSASDHSSFWDYDKPAIMVIEDLKRLNPCYHSSCDKTDIVDFGFLTSIANSVARMIIDNF